MFLFIVSFSFSLLGSAIRGERNFLPRYNPPDYFIIHMQKLKSFMKPENVYGKAISTLIWKWDRTVLETGNKGEGITISVPV